MKDDHLRRGWALPVLSWNTTISLLAMALVALACLLTLPPVPVQPQTGPPGSASETLQGRVLRVLDQPAASDGVGGQQMTQQVLVEITQGERKGHAVEVEYGTGLIMTPDRRLREGDRVLVEHSVSPVGERYYVSDFVRLPFILLLALVFVLATVIVGQQVGLRSLASTGYVALIVAVFVLPRLAAGQDPLSICVVGALLAMAPSLYLTYGWGWKTHSALAGLMVSLLVTSLVATASMEWGRMTGFGSDEATYLVTLVDVSLDMRALLLGGVIIGALGVLDDVCVGQASTTLELKRANPALAWHELFRRGMRVGRDHIASMVNTLMMAYVGAALPLFLLLITANAPLLQTLNRELLAEEIVRTLVGSLGLILAVPITSAVASLAPQRLETRPAGAVSGD